MVLRVDASAPKSTISSPRHNRPHHPVQAPLSTTGVVISPQIATSTKPKHRHSRARRIKSGRSTRKKFSTPAQLQPTVVVGVAANDSRPETLTYEDNNGSDVTVKRGSPEYEELWKAITG